MLEDYLSELRTPEPVLLNISDLPRGIDNYHIDVTLSKQFCADFETLLRDFLAIETSIKQPRLRNNDIKNRFRDSYVDMMTVLINRVKTDLSPEEVNFLQFAVYRFILESTRNVLDSYIRGLRTKASERGGSGKTLGIQEHVFWLRKHYNTILYAINRHFFIILNQCEKKELQALRRQYLGAGDEIYLEILFNPMLLSADLDSADFLIEKFLLWNTNSERSSFPDLNTHLETLCREWLPEAPFTPLVEQLKAEEKLEVYDDLGGLKACKHMLGPSPDMKNFISENFSWMDEPANFNHLFNQEKLQEAISVVRKQEGFRAAMQFKKDTRRLKTILKRMHRILGNKKLILQLAASNATRRLWSRQLAQVMDPLVLCRYLGGEFSFKDLQKRLTRDYRFPAAEEKMLKESSREVKQEVTRNLTEVLIKFLAVMGTYRRQLKHYRFAHRAFNRISILTDEEKIRLSTQAGTLYQLPMAGEVEETEVRIAHHAILKADVRGSTTVTDELEKKQLNPASYFSLRFFGPINKVLETYGAKKVFIEGDAVILSFLEYEHTPQHWYAVAHACGMAKAMLSVVTANNKYSAEMGLPPIELGIGICFADYPPRYLYDGETPIMISSAIGDADRMSSCSWLLREAMKQHSFNVEVLEIDAGDRRRGEKGQQQLRYNVNGILLSNEGFKKLGNEIPMTRLTGQVAGANTVFYYGEYPDTSGRKRNLVIREGRVGLWKHNAVHPGDSDEPFYEVVTNPQITAGIQKKMHATADS